MQRSEMGRETSKRKERHGGGEGGRGGGEREIEQGKNQRRQYQIEGKGGKVQCRIKREGR